MRSGRLSHDELREGIDENMYSQRSGIRYKGVTLACSPPADSRQGTVLHTKAGLGVNRHQKSL